jgi:ureidoacrylate peracid hydrolase
VESAGRDAYFRDYYVTLVEDCCGGASEEDHRSALKRFNRDYGLVVNSSDVMSAWEGIAPARKADPATSDANLTS